eukprot:CFRG4757T1
MTEHCSNDGGGSESEILSALTLGDNPLDGTNRCMSGSGLYETSNPSKEKITDRDMQREKRSRLVSKGVGSDVYVFQHTSPNFTIESSSGEFSVNVPTRWNAYENSNYKTDGLIQSPLLKHTPPNALRMRRRELGSSESALNSPTMLLNESYRSSSPHMYLMSRENSHNEYSNSPNRVMSPANYKSFEAQEEANPFNDEPHDIAPTFGMSKFEYFQHKIDGLIAENKRLNDQLLAGSQPPNVKDTIRALWNGEICRLDRYKSLNQKCDLLDSVLEYQDGESINSVLDFLDSTLHEDIFHGLMDKRPVAQIQWVAMLSERGDWRRLCQYHISNGHVKRALNALLEELFMTENALDRIVLLRDCTEICESNANKSPDSLTWEKQMIEYYMALLVRQLPIEKHDRELEEAGNDAFLVTYPRPGSIVGTSVVSTLHYCLFYHFLAPDDRLSSHKSIMKAFDISLRHYTWVAVTARAELQDWHAIQNMFASKPGYFGSKKGSVISIGAPNLIDLLHTYDAPLTLIRRFYSAIHDKHERYLAVVAGEFVEDAIETWVEMKDMSALRRYLADIEEGRLGLNAADIINYGDRIRQYLC